MKNQEEGTKKGMKKEQKRKNTTGIEKGWRRDKSTKERQKRKKGEMKKEHGRNDSMANNGTDLVPEWGRIF